MGLGGSFFIDGVKFKDGREEAGTRAHQADD
jgi:hypothetical protein